MREDTGDVLSCMTDEYKLVTNQEIMNVAVPVIKKHDGVIRESEILSDGKRASWKFNFPKITVSVGEDDNLNPEIIIRNSYDGFWELSILGGAFRLVCSNGMVVGTITSKKSNRHSVYNPSLEKIEEMIVSTVVPDKFMEPFAQYLMGKKMETFWDLYNALTWINTHHMSRRAGTTHKFESSIHPTVLGWAQKAAVA